MVRVEVSKVVKAPRKKAWELWSDPQKHLQFEKNWKSVEIVDRAGNTIKWRQVAEIDGKQMELVVETTQYPPERSEDKFVKGPLEGSSVVTFYTVPDGTEITVSYNVSFKGFLGSYLFGLFDGEKMREAVENTLENFARFLEKTE